MAHQSTVSLVDGFVTVKEAADMLGVAERTIYDYLWRGALRYARMGTKGNYLICVDDIHAMRAKDHAAVMQAHSLAAP